MIGWSEKFRSEARELSDGKRQNMRNKSLFFLHFGPLKVPTEATRRRFSKQDKTKSITPSIQTLIEQIEAEAFEEDEFEYQDMFLLTALL